MPTTRSQAALQRAASDAPAPSTNRTRQRSQTPALQQMTSHRRRQTPLRSISVPETENRQQNERSPSVVELPRDTPPVQLLAVAQDLTPLQNETIDLTADSSPDQTPEPEPEPPRPRAVRGRESARMTTGGTAIPRMSIRDFFEPRPYPRMSTGDNAAVRRPGRPPKPSAHMSSGGKRPYPYPVSDLSAEDDDEEFPVIKELEQERKKERSDDTAGASAAITCPICFDDSATIAKEGRQMMSTVCGHVYCSSCIKGLFAAGPAKTAECPKCRKKIKSKQIHPIFF